MSQTCYVQNCVNFATVIGNWLNGEEIVNVYEGNNNIGAITGRWQANTNAGERVIVSNSYFLKNSAKVTRNSDESYVNFGCGGAGNSWVHNKGCSILNSATAEHTCVSVETPEIKANCTYGGHSAYSYCLICGSVTSGTKTVTETNDTHFYAGATCTANGVCQLCGDANGPKDPNNHVSSDNYIYEKNAYDESKHDALCSRCAAFIKTEGHSYDTQGKCTKCTYKCAHPTYTDGKCDACAYKCAHDGIENNKCTTCGLEGSVKYINRVWNSTTKQVDETVEIAPVDIIEFTSATTELSDGWYIAKGKVNNSKVITVSGTVHLILADGAALTTLRCAVNKGNSLYIYAQSSGAGMGSWKLTASGSYNAVLGGTDENSAGKIVINGGSVSASGNKMGAAIGSGYAGTDGEIIINGGLVQASYTSTNDGAAIGSGRRGTNVSVVINGGTVSAISYYGAGIGGGSSGTDGNSVVINGGNIYTSSSYGENVGAGYEGAGVTVTDGNGNDVTLNTITLSGAAADTPVTKVEGITYGLTDVKTLDTDKLYFYLPADAVATSVTAGGIEYICNSNLTYYTAHDWSNNDGICANGCGTECLHENETGETCTVCGATLHTCDFSGEWQYNNEKHWKECDCGLTSEEATHSFTDGACSCGYKCLHESYTDGICDNCEYACPHSWGEGVLTRPIRVTTTDWDDGYYTYTCLLCDHYYQETVKRADYSAYDAIVDKVNEYLNDATLTSEAKHEIYSTFTNFGQDNENISSSGLLRGDLIESEQAIVDEVAEEMQEIIDSVEAKIASGEYVKADYTEIDKAIAEIEDKLGDENITDEGKAGLEEIKEQLEEMKADGNTSEADLAELEKALEDYEAELDKGIEDGTLVEVDGLEEIVKINDALNEELTEKYGEDALAELADKISDEVNAKFDELYEKAEALTGTVAENKEALAEIEAEMEAIFAEIEKCLAGTHSYKYEVTSPAKCGENAIETGICAVCGATDERETPGTALEHIFVDYTSNGDATCTADGTKTAECIHGCGETDTVTDEGSKLSHADEDGDKVCDDCEAEIIDTCPDCGRPVHEDTLAHNLFCLIIMLINLIKTMF